MSGARAPLCIDLCCGSGGWTDGFLAAGYQVIGFDIHRRRDYKGQLVIQDVLTVSGHHMNSATIIVASPMCNEFTRANPKNQLTGHLPDMRLVDACYRIAREARRPLVLENVHGAQRWLGPAVHHYGKFYLWGDGVPALLPQGPRWKDKTKSRYRSAALRARVPFELAFAVARYHLTICGAEGRWPDV